jgi:deoxyribodipyrimidine photolyase-related protein
LKQFFRGKKTFLMERFCRMMRKKHYLLMEGENPLGGKWNYDVENCQKYDGKVAIPAPMLFKNDVSKIFQEIVQTGIEYFGEVDPAQLIWPINRRQSLELLNSFVSNLLPCFGTYQDAMIGQSWSLFHSRLSFALNSKMLNPREVVKKAIEQWKNRQNEIGLSQIEGFIRQIIGWREYMRGIYWSKMPDFEKLNFLGHKKNLPEYYWTGNTRMNCLKNVIRQSLKYAYAHHIQRLMVTGNFALLSEIDPDQLDQWYLGIYIDTIQWVEITNTRGMSQFADGGIVGSKPYISSANYINKMSDYCHNCFYDHRLRFGKKACPFNSFFWDFYQRHRLKLEKNPRVAVIYRNLDQMKAEELEKILQQAQFYKKELNNL